MICSQRIRSRGREGVLLQNHFDDVNGFASSSSFFEDEDEDEDDYETSRRTKNPR
jgi:hypothetical protein